MTRKIERETFKDLTGQKFGHLLVLEREDYTPERGDAKVKVRWICECDCGSIVKKYKNQLKHKTRIVSCGCMTPKKELKYDLLGQEFGFLTVLSRSTDKGGGRDYMWECLCICGGQVLVSTNNLRWSFKKSCGCKTKAETSGTHGMSGTPTHTSWRTMRERCTKEYHKSYEHYRDKWVCQEWLDSFEAFYNDMGERPEGFTLDRVDNSLGYFKENCRWADITLQNQNKVPTYKNKNKGLAGVGKTKDGKFRARITFKRVVYEVGTFNTPEEANNAYNKKGHELAGEDWVYKGAPPDEARPSSRPPK